MATTQEMTELAQVIKERRSIRKWQDKPVPEELLLSAIELATWAPNNGNRQNWRFYLVTNRQVINSIADAVDKASDEVNSWPEMVKIARPRPEGAPPPRRPGFFRQAPALIMVATSSLQTPQDQALEERGKSDPRAVQVREWRNSVNVAIQSADCAVSHLLLALHQAGLGAVWLHGPLQAKGEIEKIINLPPEMGIRAFIPVGYPDETPETRGRKPVSEVCEIIR
ncbi:MAG: nitroreductase family protein [Dehalococcoidales bacterium]